MVSYENLPSDPFRRRQEIDRRIEAEIGDMIARRRKLKWAAAGVLAIALAGAFLFVRERLHNPPESPIPHIEAAAALRARGDLPAAARELDAALELDSTRLGVRRLRAELALALGDAAGARAHYRLASPDGRGPIVELGELEADLLDGHFASVAKRASTKLARSPGAELEIVLVQARLGLRELSAADDVLEKLLGRLPHSRQGWLVRAHRDLALGDADAVSRAVAELGDHPNDTERLLLQGELALLEAEPDKAAHAFEAAARNAPGHPETLLGLARTFLVARDPRTAARMLSKLSTPSVPLVVRYLKARVELLNGRSEPAVQAAHRVLEEDPGFLDARYLIAEAAFSDGRFDAAADTLGPLTDGPSAARRDPAAVTLLARAYLAAGRPALARGLLAPVAERKWAPAQWATWLRISRGSQGSNPGGPRTRAGPAVSRELPFRRPLQRCNLVVFTCLHCLYVRQCL